MDIMPVYRFWREKSKYAERKFGETGKAGIIGLAKILISTASHIFLSMRNTKHIWGNCSKYHHCVLYQNTDEGLKFLRISLDNYPFFCGNIQSIRLFFYFPLMKNPQLLTDDEIVYIAQIQKRYERYEPQYRIIQK